MSKESALGAAVSVWREDFWPTGAFLRRCEGRSDICAPFPSKGCNDSPSPLALMWLPQPPGWSEAPEASAAGMKPIPRARSTARAGGPLLHPPWAGGLLTGHVTIAF